MFRCLRSKRTSRFDYIRNETTYFSMIKSLLVPFSTEGGCCIYKVNKTASQTGSQSQSDRKQEEAFCVREAGLVGLKRSSLANPINQSPIGKTRHGQMVVKKRHSTCARSMQKSSPLHTGIRAHTHTRGLVSIQITLSNHALAWN